MNKIDKELLKYVLENKTLNTDQLIKFGEKYHLGRLEVGKLLKEYIDKGYINGNVIFADNTAYSMSSNGLTLDGRIFYDQNKTMNQIKNYSIAIIAAIISGLIVEMIAFFYFK